MFVVFEHEGLFLRSGTEITQLERIHSEMEVRAHFPVHAQCCTLTARAGVLIRCQSAMTKLPSQLQPLNTQELLPGADGTSS